MFGKVKNIVVKQLDNVYSSMVRKSLKRAARWGVRV
jgi:hypothetical protein